LDNAEFLSRKYLETHENSLKVGKTGAAAVDLQHGDA
jgi:hypothetical protein